MSKMLIELSLRKNEADALIESLPKEPFNTIRLKPFDGTQVVQFIVDVSGTVIPTVIAAICGYVAASKIRPKIKIKISDTTSDRTIELEVEGLLNDKTLNDSQLYSELLRKIKESLEVQGNDTNS